MEITNLNLIDVWKDRIKEHEGFRLEPYNLSYGNVTESFQTGGYGHRIIPGEEIPTTKEGWDKVSVSHGAETTVDGGNLKGMKKNQIDSNFNTLADQKDY